MKCEYPIIMAGRAFGCGQCLPCRFNRRRVWAHRILLEAKEHAANCFVTLTYSDDALPPDGSLRKTDLQDFLKRLRASVAPVRLRFYAVGEYGDNSWRPHYHVALFGYPNCRFGTSNYSGDAGSCCKHCDHIRSTWGHGLVHVGELNAHSAQYVAQYVTKKMTMRNDPRLRGRDPEFATMSLKPGIGAGAASEIASTMLEFNLDKSQSDVPVTLRHGSRHMPLGRYLRRKIREQIGRSPNAPQEVTDALKEEVRPMLEAAAKAAQEFLYPIPGRVDSLAQGEVIKAGEGERRNFYAKHEIFKQRKKL